ncbi:MAG TPA: LamG-like jellyroll fold domain-containing protein, partial [Verrucomicrobiae bacterium]
NGGNYNSYAGLIEGLDFAKPTGANSEFSVGAWANGEAADVGAPVLSQGTYGTSDAFGLGADTNTTERTYWFYVRSASGTVYKADSTVFADDGNWHDVIGVCDEVNSNLSLYIDGRLAATAWIPTNSGVYEASAPMAIGSGTTGGGIYNVQFFGNIDDVMAYKYALNAEQVAGIYGVPVSASLVAPLPPTYFAYLTGKTFTIPAIAFGAPPMGYYWTNVTVGGVIASGTTNVLRELNASLTVPNAPASLSGDELELVVTNSLGSTNWFVTLFTPPPPVTLDYTDGILYSNLFNGGSWSIAGMPLTAANSLLGGTNTTWTDALGTNDNGNLPASGVDNSFSQDSWELPFTPHPGYIYTVTAQVTFNAANPSGDWIGAGFAQRVVTNAAVGYGRFSDGGTTPPQEGPNGYDWILTQYTGNVQDFGGAGGANQLTSSTFFTAGTGTHTIQVVLDTTNAQWSMAGYIDGTQAGANYTYSVNPPIGAVGITQTTLNNPSAVQWDSFSVSAVAPGGVPPYLLAALPGSVSLTNATISIPATAFGSGPFGYNWTFNNSVLASGTTNNMAPLGANLSVPSSSLSSGQLELTLTNAYGTNITVVTLVSPVNPTPTNIVTTVANNNLYLTWPVDHTGWQLQAQTNTVSTGLSTNWVNVAGSATTNQVVVPINPANGTVFYRLTYNP